MKRFKIFFVFFVITGCLLAYWFVKSDSIGSSSLVIKDTKYATDADAINQLFFKGDNIYWMLLI